MNFEGIRAVVSGGASGLGLATARRIVAAGGRVLLLDLSAQQGARAARDLGERARFAVADVTDPDAPGAPIAQAAQDWGGLDVAVCCAGVVGVGGTLGKDGPVPMDNFLRTVAVNLSGTYNIVRLAAPLMRENPPGADGERGVIVMTASIAGYEGQMGHAAYAASKAGVIGMTLPLAREFARYGIRVVSIAPGLFKTPMLESLDEVVQRRLAEGVPFPSRLGEPSEYAALVESIVRQPMLNGETIRYDAALRMPPR